MENWGLITYRETALLFKPGVSALGNKQRIAIVIRYVFFYKVLISLLVSQWLLLGIFVHKVFDTNLNLGFSKKIRQSKGTFLCQSYKLT